MADPDVRPLPLDSPRWSELKHVFGSAADMPDAIRRLQDSSGPLSGGPLDEIQNAIFHQGDPDTGSYASVPHLVRIAESREPNEKLELLLCCSWIELYRTSRRPPVPEDLSAAYHQALRLARAMLIQLLSMPAATWNSDLRPITLRCTFTAIAALSGDRRLAHLIDHVDDLQHYIRQEDPAHWPPWPE